MFFVVKQLLKLCLCRKPSCDFVNFHDWPSWQKVTMTRPTTWRFWPVDALETCKDRCRARCSSCVLFVSHTKLHSETVATVLAHFENLIIKGMYAVQFPFSPTTMKSGMLVGTFQSSVARESCKGIEFNPDLRRCEVWIKPVCYSGGFLLQAVPMTFFPG